MCKGYCTRGPPEDRKKCCILQTRFETWLYSTRLASRATADNRCCREEPPGDCKECCRRIASMHTGLWRRQIGGLVPKPRYLHQPPVSAISPAAHKPEGGFSFNGRFNLPKILGLVPIQRKNRKSKINILPYVWVYVTGRFIYLNCGEL